MLDAAGQHHHTHTHMLDAAGQHHHTHTPTCLMLHTWIFWVQLAKLKPGTGGELLTSEEGFCRKNFQGDKQFLTKE
jgi:hypothetical protein